MYQGETTCDGVAKNAEKRLQVVVKESKTIRKLLKKEYNYFVRTNSAFRGAL